MSATRLTFVSLLPMPEDVLRFRRQAADCRQLAKNARDARDRDLLNDIAEELDAEADRIEADSQDKS